MKYLFVAMFALLVLASLFTHSIRPESQNDLPLIYWVTDANPARKDQIHLFHLWLVKQGHKKEKTLATADDASRFLSRYSSLYPLRESLLVLNPELRRFSRGESVSFPLKLTLPITEMRVDTANNDATKKIIQGVSGVGGDVMDMFSGQTMWQFNGMKLLREVTEDAKRLGFDPSQTYPALLPEIAIPDREGNWHQFQFPCNVTANAFIVNLEAFQAINMPEPPARWDVATFERIGREYVERANTTGQRRRNFFANDIDLYIFRRLFGASELNETMTACTLDSPGSVEAIQTYKRWRDELRLIPSAADRAAFATESGYGGADAQLFNRGNFALFGTGRYLLIQFRQFNIDRIKAGQSPMKLAVSEFPYRDIPITNMSTRAAAVYAGSPHQDLAILFQQFLASEDYNVQIVRDADALPPNPKYTQSEEYLRPATDPENGIYPETEHRLHGPFRDLAETIGVANTHSPFILYSTVTREINKAQDIILSIPNANAKEVFADYTERINDLIARNLAENPSLKPLYDEKIELQKEIDRMKRDLDQFTRANPNTPIPSDLRIPLKLLDNPFHRAYYQHLGWTRE
jgi:multiple sugar transport system substrate-binding protein